MEERLKGQKWLCATATDKQAKINLTQDAKDKIQWSLLWPCVPQGLNKVEQVKQSLSLKQDPREGFDRFLL